MIDQMSGLVGWAQRRTAEGVLETAGFLGAPAERIFGFVHVPSGRIRGSVLICPPLLAETLVTYRSDVKLAESLSASGCAVLRFHHRGSGHSDGLPQDASLDSLVDDALMAGDTLSEVSGRPIDVVVGTRIGATVAALAAVRLGVPRVALIAPVLDPKAYFREVFRGHLLSEMKTRTKRLTINELERRLHEDGWVDILGYPLGAELVRSIGSLPLAQVLQPPLQSVLLAQIGTGQGEEASVEALSRELVHSGIRCSASTLPISLAWWFGGGSFSRPQNEAAASGVIDLVRAWLKQEIDVG